MSNLVPTPEIETALKRYLEIQETEKALKEEKRALQAMIAEYMGRGGTDQWLPTIDGEPLKIRRSVRVKVEYDEDLLRERLGPKYVELLAPNAKKMAQRNAEVVQALGPLLAEVGSVDRDRVRAAVERGTIRVEEFSGAFEKTERPTVMVARQKT